MLLVELLLRKVRDFLTCLAESEGFKPPIPERGIPDFESSAIDHSANSPLADAKVKRKNELTKFFPRKRINFIRKTVSIVCFSAAQPRICGC